MIALRRAAFLLAAVLVVGACIPPQATVDRSPSPAASATAPASGTATASSAPVAADMSAALLAKPLPEVNIFDLTRRMRGRDGQPAGEFQPVRATPPVEGVGTEVPYWTYDFAAKKPTKITATLRVITDHAKWWVQNDVQFDLEQLRVSATAFETKVYPTTRRLYGEEWTPGVDSDPRINILLVRIPGAAAGYFNSSDELPLWVNEFSSERETVYINSLAARPGTTYLSSVVAHEFCHMIQYGKRKRSQVWFNEGQAQLCEQANGFPVSHAQTFLQLPDTQLNDWPELEQSQAHYGLAYLFLEFARQQAGGDDLINAFMAKGIDTPADLDAVLRSRGQRGIEELFADFAAANAFIGSSAEAKYSYPNGLAARTPAGATDQDRVTLGNTVSSSTHEYATRYIELPRATMKVHFDGARQTRLLPTDPHSGKAMWWSDRADDMDSTLTRTVDLRSATAPKLSYWTWYEIEKDYDYAYVAVSTDGGARWTTLAAPGTTRDDPNGNNLGSGYTDLSGGGRAPAWTQQEVDLTPYAGKEIQLRFEYVTDAALNLHGLAIDDIVITGLLNDDAESDNGWTANGFVRSTNLVAQRFVVQLLRFTGSGTSVDRRSVDGGILDLDVDTSADRRPPLLAVTGFAVRTTQPVPFSVSVERR
ncbi:MAG: choice-of-anchor J domain-containing protein [Chloroflexota bacterium]